MDNLFKAGGHLTADPVGRGVDVIEFRMGFFQFLQFVHQHVIFIVGDRRVVFDIILVVILLKLLAQLVNAAFNGIHHLPSFLCSLGKSMAIVLFL